MNIAGLNKVHVLQALFTKAVFNGHPGSPQHGSDMSHSEAEHLLAEGKWFDHLHQRRMFVDLNKDVVDTSLYNQYNGAGAAESAIEHLHVAAAL